MNEPEDIFSLKASLDSQSIEIEELQEEIERLRTELDEAKKEIKSLEDLLEDYRRDLNAHQWREDNL
jgi:peptidoglycan hydrolase CwlO-like protein